MTVRLDIYSGADGKRVAGKAIRSPVEAKALADLDINGSPEAVTIKAVLNASKMLRAGYTSAVSFGSLHGVDVELHRHIEQGLIPGPRYRPCGRDVTGTSGMVDWNPDYLKLGMEGLGVIADNPWQVRSASSARTRSSCTSTARG
jgi:hypothetical protein